MPDIRYQMPDARYQPEGINLIRVIPMIGSVINGRIYFDVMKFRITLMTFIFLGLLSGCCEDILPGVPDCIEDQIREFRKDPCDDKQVNLYRFQNQNVYVFGIDCCCDAGSAVWDAECNQLGILGGFAGNTEINGEAFSNAEFILTVWEK